MVKKILFICRHNRFRSKVAEAFFNKFNKNKKYLAQSAGLFPGRYPLDKMQIKIAKESGIVLKGKPRPITTDLLRKINIIVIAADDVPAEIFNTKKYGIEEYAWNIPDADTENEIKTTIKMIEEHIKAFLRGLK